MRRIFFDTETTGTSVREGHRVIEIGCVETIDFKKTGNVFHYNLNPEREIDAGATRVHGKTFQMLKNERKFAEIADAFLEFVDGAELIAHNAQFDVGFTNFELSNAGRPALRNEITDSLVIARKYFPGQPASLDALCKRFTIDNSGRTFHGALLDAELLCDMFVKMIELLESEKRFGDHLDYKIKKEKVEAIKRNTNFAYRKFETSPDDLEKHKEFLKTIGF